MKSIAKRTHKGLLLLILCHFALVFDLSAQAEITQDLKILTIGNSFSRNACYYLEDIVSSFDGLSIEIVRGNLSGFSLQKHVELIDSCENNPGLKPYLDQYTLRDLLLLHEYDFITIQQLSLESFKLESFQPYAQTLVDYIRKYNPEAKIAVHQTWPYAKDAKRLASWEMSQTEMYQRLSTNYGELASEYNTFILPSGDAFYYASIEHKLDVWTSDRHHANTYGKYLAGCVWFGKLFGISPLKITFVPEDMDFEIASTLRDVAQMQLKE